MCQHFASSRHAACRLCENLLITFTGCICMQMYAYCRSCIQTLKSAPLRQRKSLSKNHSGSQPGSHRKKPSQFSACSVRVSTRRRSDGCAGRARLRRPSSPVNGTTNPKPRSRPSEMKIFILADLALGAALLLICIAAKVLKPTPKD